MSGHWFVYIIETQQGKLYTGITTEVSRRFQEHQDVASGKANAKGAKFFRSQIPKQVVFQQQCDSRSEATKLEMRIKKMPVQKKQALITSAQE